MKDFADAIRRYFFHTIGTVSPIDNRYVVLLFLFTPPPSLISKIQVCARHCEALRLRGKGADGSNLEDVLSTPAPDLGYVVLHWIALPSTIDIFCTQVTLIEPEANKRDVQNLLQFPFSTMHSFVASSDPIAMLILLLDKY